MRGDCDPLITAFPVVLTEKKHLTFDSGTRKGDLD